MFILSLKLLLKGEETVTVDSSSKGSTVTVQTKEFKVLQCTKYVINAKLHICLKYRAVSVGCSLMCSTALMLKPI